MMTLRRNWISLLFAMIALLCGLFAWSFRGVLADTAYTVHQGDTLWGIAQTHHTTVNQLQRRNHLHATILQIHQVLMIPIERYSGEAHRTATHSATSVAPSRKNRLREQKRAKFVAYHTVQPGNTLWQIALDNHMSVQHLMMINHLTSDMLMPGQKLRVYEGSKSAWDRIQYAKYASQGMPVQLISVYRAAGHRFSVPWTVLAAIHHQETDYSTTGDEVSPAGAIGPMQFMPSTFAAYAVAAPGEPHTPNIHNVSDAIYTCAHMLAADGYNENPTMALYLYNHSLEYVQSVQEYAASV